MPLIDTLGEIQCQIAGAVNMSDIAADMTCNALQAVNGDAPIAGAEPTAIRIRFAVSDVYRRLTEIENALSHLVETDLAAAPDGDGSGVARGLSAEKRVASIT